MNKEELLKKMYQSVVDGEEDDSRDLAEQAVTGGMNPIEAMDEGFLKGIQEAGRLYEAGEYYLPDLVCSADAMKTALAVLQPELDKLVDRKKALGKVVAATVQGDIHDIGKTIVVSMMIAAGFEVIDLGADVPSEEIIETARKEEADFICLSALLTTTMDEQRVLIEMLKEKGLRDRIKVLVGGAPVSREWAERIGADGYGDTAVDAVASAKRLING